MTLTGHHNSRTTQSIALLVVSIFLMMVLFPSHFHLVHEAGQDPGSAETAHHATIAHSGSMFEPVAEDPNAHTLETSSEYLIKVSTPLIPLLLFFLLLATPEFRILRLARVSTLQPHVQQIHWHTSPPLRAPPHR